LRSATGPTATACRCGASTSSNGADRAGRFLVEETGDPASLVVDDASALVDTAPCGVSPPTVPVGVAALTTLAAEGLLTPVDPACGWRKVPESAVPGESILGAFAGDTTVAAEGDSEMLPVDLCCVCVSRAVEGFADVAEAWEMPRR
jgi:hypothetical protein